ncbi:MAG: hypothetical protein EOM69_01550 [Clostridia bacterium]|nr:hypothetical protein [Clostridia bacterium]
MKRKSTVLLSLLLALCLLLPTAAHAVTLPVTVQSELQAAELLANAAENGDRSMSFAVPQNFDYNLLYDYTRMMYPGYFGISWRVRGQTATVTMQLHTEEEHKAARAEAKKIVAALITSDMSEREALTAIEDYLAAHCEYDYDAARNQQTAAASAFSAYGALVLGKAVCDGYSSAFGLLCREAGIPCLYIGSDELNHSWNAVFHDGEIYFIDATYDDQGTKADKTYFLKTRTEMQALKKGWDTARADAVTSYLWGSDYVYARQLQRLGLFRGTDKGFELTRTPRRDEAAVMLTRYLGVERTAQASDVGLLVFTDITDFYKPYIAYLYTNGLTQGTSETTYSSASGATAAQYMTFLLRALGYSEEKGDFSWRTSLTDAARLGVISQAEAEALGKNAFDRGAMARVSYRTLTAQTARGTLLCEELVSAGALSVKKVGEVLK